MRLLALRPWPSVRRGTGAVMLALLCAVGAALAQGPPPSQNVLAGSRVFGDQGCARCHAIGGVGGGVGPDLARLGGTHSMNGLAAALWDHLPQMSARMRELGVRPPQLSTQQTSDLVAFLFWVNYFSPPGNATVGKQLFTQKHCVLCHQIGGVGGVVGPALDARVAEASPIAVAAAMWNHGPTMSDSMRARGVQRPTFTAAELSDLLAYLSADVSTPPQGPVFVLPGNPDDGRELFTSKNCVGCHSVRGLGGTRAPDLGQQPRQSALELAAAMWNMEPRMTAVMRQARIEFPQLTPAEMADLVGYLASVQYVGQTGAAARGRQTLRTRGCLGCHALDGRGGTGAPDLGRVRGLTSSSAVIGALWSHIRIADSVSAERWPALRPGDVADLEAFFKTTGGER
jgi:mono/diheme cytochrome c family protein